MLEFLKSTVRSSRYIGIFDMGYRMTSRDGVMMREVHVDSVMIVGQC